MIDFDDYVQYLLNGYRSSYDIECTDDDNDELFATAHMHMEQVQNFIFKEFRMSSADADEYVYIFHAGHLTEGDVEKFINRAYDDGYPKIKLEHYSFSHQHMCTRIVVLIICDDADDAAVKKIRKSRIYKSFQFSLKGWMEVHTALLKLSDGSVDSNFYGRETAKYLKMHVANYLRQRTENKQSKR